VRVLSDTGAAESEQEANTQGEPAHRQPGFRRVGSRPHEDNGGISDRV
jgi:hypothetical protein